MDKEFPLYPDLSEEGKIEANQLLISFKEKIKKIITDVVDDTMGEMYSNIMPYIESDSWGNFRDEIMRGMKDYNNRRIQGEYDFKEIRWQIYKEYRDDIIKDLDQDNLKEIEDLKGQVKFLNEARFGRF